MYLSFIDEDIFVFVESLILCLFAHAKSKLYRGDKLSIQSTQLQTRPIMNIVDQMLLSGQIFDCCVSLYNDNPIKILLKTTDADGRSNHKACTSLIIIIDKKYFKNR